MKLKKLSISLILSLLIFTMFINVSATEIAYVDCSALNVRTSPNTNCAIIDTLPNGTTFEIIYADNGWYNIRLSDGTTGFVSANYVKLQNVALENSESAADVIGQNVANSVKMHIGKRYVYGSNGPNSFDCSGLTSYVYRQFGISLPRTSNSQGSVGTYVQKSDLKPGDLVLFSNRGDRRINHVGIYVGDSKFVHASTSSRGVVMDDLNESYYVRNYVTARRVL